MIRCLLFGHHWSWLPRGRYSCWAYEAHNVLCTKCGKLNWAHGRGPFRV